MNKLFLIAMIIMAASVKSEVTQEDEVWVLNDSNFVDFLGANENVLVEFYAPWCGHCKSLAPEYAAAAAAVKDVAGLKIAKVDATEAKDVAAQYEIKGFPTLKFFKNGVSTDYQGGRTKDAIVEYCLKKSGPSVNDVATADDLTALQAKANVAVVYFGSKDTDAYAAFSAYAGTNDDVLFGVASVELGATVSAVDGQVVLFKTFDEKRNDLAPTVTLDSIAAFVSTNSVPNVLPFDNKAIELVFHKQTPCVFLFNDDSKDGAADADTAFAAAALATKGQGVIFSFSKPTDGSGNFQKLADYVGADIAAAPVVMLVHQSEGGLDKYKYTTTISTENLSTFVADYTAGKLTKFLKSAEAPATNDEPVKVIVGTTFNDIVINNDKDVLVEFYAPWCGHCKTLEPKYTEAATKLAGNPNVVLAKCDATANEVDGVAIQGFPTLKFWPGNAKSSAPVDFDGAREVDDIISYMKNHATKEWVEVAATATTTDDL